MLKLPTILLGADLKRKHVLKQVAFPAGDLESCSVSQWLRNWCFSVVNKKSTLTLFTFIIILVLFALFILISC